ncbi:MAG: hypothetical protein PHH67_10500 [Methanosarcina sp.]|nr:hypothetical protein [Methanosarcina sp.]
MQQPELQRYMTWIMGFGQKTASEHREFRKIVFFGLDTGPWKCLNPQVLIAVNKIPCVQTFVSEL